MQFLQVLNIWLIDLSMAGVLPDSWLCEIVEWIDTACVILGFGPQLWG